MNFESFVAASQSMSISRKEFKILWEALPSGRKLKMVTDFAIDPSVAYMKADDVSRCFPELIGYVLSICYNVNFPV